ncbi:MAG: DUF2505 domain-containing protein [Polyangiaceae bacterium]|nr:DUF2505 domain-containing protein [Polyangiaceae bacterium]
MPTVTFTHEINCDEATFWELFLDKEFNDKLYKQGLEFSEWSIVEQTETDSEIKRTTKGKPKLKNIPGPVAKILGDSFGYSETGSMDKKNKVWKYKLTPSTMAEKIKQEGTLRISPAGDGKVKRSVELLIEAKIFGIGGMIESTVEKQLRDGWDASASFMNKWLAEHKK